MKKRTPLTSPSQFIGIEKQGLISFGAGQPDLPPPQEVMESLKKINCEYKYGMIQGDLSLRQKVASLHSAQEEDVIITNGASEALFLALSVSIKPGDKVLLTRPYYYSYPWMVKLCHGQPIYTDLIEGQVDLDDFREKFSDAQVAILNTPANPTGSVLKPETVKSIEDLCNTQKKIVIFDEVYESLIYKGEHYSPRSPYVVNINSFSKTFSMCGFRVGYAYSENGIIRDMVDHKTHSSMNTSRIAQQMALIALDTPVRFAQERLSVWKERRDYIYKRLTDMDLDVWSPDGAFYIFPKVDDASEAVEDLFYDHDVVTYKGEWFGMPERMRLSYALDIEKIVEGMDRLERYLKSR